MEKKMTKAEMFNTIQAIINDIEDFDESKVTKDEVNEFLDKQVELTKKNKDTKANKEKIALDNSLKADIIANLSAEGTTVTDLYKASDVFASTTTQKITSLLKTLVTEGSVKREEVKGKPYYSLV